jgi:5-methylcytosine-specific restriction endonuclease McrA
MSDITKSINFDKRSLKIINNKLSKNNFNHKNWEDDDLKPLKIIIRKYYRTIQKGKCAYCKKSISSTSPFNCQVEHIVPKSLHLNFIFTPKNLCVICGDCNQIKGNQETLVDSKIRKKYPASTNAFKIVHPHFDNYYEHIEIFNNKYYCNKTPKGHFTIGICNLNRELQKFGWEIDLVKNLPFNKLVQQYLDEKNISKKVKNLFKIKNYFT